jgi:trk system potassium uptake protein TrkA
MTKAIGVIGLGRFGSTVAKTLCQLGHKVLAIDSNGANIDSICNNVTWARRIEYTIDNFKECGIADCSTVVVAIGHSLQENLLVTMMMKELKINRIISRSIDTIHASILEKIGVDKIINPEQDMGMRLANQIVSSDVLELIEISPEYSVHHMKALPDMVGKTLGELNLRKRYEVVVIAIKRKEEMIIVPTAKDKINEGDDIIVIVRTVNLKNLIKLAKD